MKWNKTAKYLQNIILMCITTLLIITSISQCGIILTHENPIALWIPFIESIIAISLVISRTRLKGLMAATMILLLWTLCNGYRVVTGVQLPFSYGGIHASFKPMEQFCLSVAMLLLSCMGMTLFLINSYHDSRSSRIPV